MGLTIREFSLVGDGGSVYVGGRHFIRKEKFIGKSLVMMTSLLIQRGVELTDEREKRTRNQVLLYVWRLCPWGPDF